MLMAAIVFNLNDRAILLSMQKIPSPVHWFFNRIVTSKGLRGRSRRRNFSLRRKRRRASILARYSSFDNAKGLARCHKHFVLVLHRREARG